jgi:hypothetical protein
MFFGAPFCLNQYMSLTRFNDISAALCLTNERVPTVAKDGFVDHFHDVRKVLDAFNNHMDKSYIQLWLSILHKSMNFWLDKLCPGFMCVPWKPHPFDNEYHLIADGDEGKPIMWKVKLVEEMDWLRKAYGSWAFPSEFEQMPKTAKTMVEMTKPIHSQGKVVIGDSGFCVQDRVVACHQRGVFFQAYVKKQSHWPKGVPKALLGYCETLVQINDGVRFLVHCCRDSKYVAKIMSTHGMLDEIQDHLTYRKVNGWWKTFKYAKPFLQYSKAKHWVNDHNNRRHDPIGLEEVWGTKW